MAESIRDSYEVRENERNKRLDEFKTKEITIDGITVKLGILFPQDYELEDFVAKLNLLTAGTGKNSEESEEYNLFGG